MDSTDLSLTREGGGEKGKNYCLKEWQHTTQALLLCARTTPDLHCAQGLLMAFLNQALTLSSPKSLCNRTNFCIKKLLTSTSFISPLQLDQPNLKHLHEAHFVNRIMAV